MLKQTNNKADAIEIIQPPSGGCVLKLPVFVWFWAGRHPAAFRRLCVETVICYRTSSPCQIQPPSGGCVLKPRSARRPASLSSPAAFRRLCVETPLKKSLAKSIRASRLQAAVC